MWTYTHGLIGYVLYARRSREERRVAAAGAMLPDVLLAVGYIFHVMQPWSRLSIVADLHALFHHSPLHTVTIALHSFVLGGAALAIALIRYRRALPFVVGVLSHGVIDLFTHQGSGYNHFFPIVWPPVRGPFDYTDPVFTVLEHVGLAATLAWLLVRRHRTRSDNELTPAAAIGSVREHTTAPRRASPATATGAVSGRPQSDGRSAGSGR